jgi:biopolymer transport protein ExbB
MTMRYRFIPSVLAALAICVMAAAVAHAQESGRESPPADSASVGAAVPSSVAPFTIKDALRELRVKFKAGGATMYFLLALSVASFAFVVERSIRLRQNRIVPLAFSKEVDRLWSEGNLTEIRRLCDADSKHALSKIVRFIVDRRRASLDDLNSAVGDIAAREMGRHQMLTYPLAAIAGLSPLLGLFGTVLGMILSFDKVAIAGEMGDPSLLAEGISKALVTTAFGLLVAIPTVFFYNIFKFRTAALATRLEEVTTALIHDWFLPKDESDER